MDVATANLSCEKSFSWAIYIFADKELLLKSVPTHAGVGTFKFTPKSEVEYRAEVRKGKKKHKFDLPKVEPRGVLINLAQSADSINVTVKNNIDFSTPLGFAVLNRGFLIDYQTFDSDDKEKQITLSVVLGWVFALVLYDTKTKQRM